MIASVLLIAAAIPVVAVGVEAVLLRRDKRGRPPLGKLVDVGGHRLHARILSAGPSSGDRPLVVLEAGEGEWSSHWGRLPEMLSAQADVLAYDRAGLGWSESGPGERDVETAALELRELLRHVAPGRKVLLVSHGWGAFVARLFAARYPFEVAGLILVDGESESLDARLDQAGIPSVRTSARLIRFMGLFGRLGFLRWTGFAACPDVDANLPESQAETIDTLWRSPRVLAGIQAEIHARPTSMGVVGKLKDRLEVPVLCLVAEESLSPDGLPQGYPRTEFNRIWRELGAGLADLSGAGRAEIVEGACHHIQLRSPHRVEAAVRDLLG